MDPERRLAKTFLASHPEEAALVLERLPPVEVAVLLEEMPATTGLAVLRRMAPSIAADCLPLLSLEHAATFLTRLSPETASGLLRRISQRDRDHLLSCITPDVSSTLALLLRYPVHTAGALMDPTILSLPNDIDVREARLRVRRSARRVLYYLYVVDRTQTLVGVLNLRELLLAAPNESLASVMRPQVARLPVRADPATILAHPGWREFHALPVVDENNVLLGALRYETLRRVEEELSPTSQLRNTVALCLAVGELYWVATGGLIQTLWRAMYPTARP